MQIYDKKLPLVSNVEKNSVNSPPLDTLAQPQEYTTNKSDVTLSKRAISKIITQKIVFPLIQLHSPLEKSYRSALYCANQLQQQGDKITSKYCGQRTCVVCNHIRTMKLIKGYGSQINKFSEPRFITLTIVNVKAEDLSNTIDKMIDNCRLIAQSIKYKTGKLITGLRKIEITYNSKDDTYHPHIHMPVDGEYMGNLFIDGWLKRYPTATRRNQKNDPVDHNTVNELFKYTTKLWKKDKSGNVVIYPPHVLDTIYQAVINRRIVQPFGGLKMVDEEITDLQATVFLTEENYFTEWDWLKDFGTWIDKTSGELRTEHINTKKTTIKQLLVQQRTYKGKQVIKDMK